MNEGLEDELYEEDRPRQYRYRRHILVYEGTEDEIEVPARWEVCYQCQGEGTHTNPSIDGRGLTREDFEEQGPEFAEDYFSGVYDIQCTKCKGSKVLLTIDYSRATDAEREAFERHEESEREYAAEMEAEQRMMEGWGM